MSVPRVLKMVLVFCSQFGFP